MEHGGRGDAPERISMMMTAFLDFSAAAPLATRQENEGVALCNGNDLGRGRERERDRGREPEPPFFIEAEYTSTSRTIDIPMI